jgi:hypothetical protein
MLSKKKMVVTSSKLQLPKRVVAYQQAQLHLETLFLGLHQTAPASKKKNIRRESSYQK